MWKRLRVRIARLLTRGTDCTVVRTSRAINTRRDAIELQDYVEKSGALNDSRWIHAHRRIHSLTTSIVNNAIDSEVP